MLELEVVLPLGLLVTVADVDVDGCVDVDDGVILALNRAKELQPLEHVVKDPMVDRLLYHLRRMWEVEP